MKSWQLENYSVSKWYGVDPGVVENEWTNIEFLDRQEYMRLQDEIDRQYRKFTERK